jgi:hypothetical protein
MKSCILYECLTPSPLNRPINPSHLAEVLPFYGILRFQSSLDPTSNRIPSVSQTGYCTPDQVEISFRDKSFGTYKIPTTYIKKWMPIILRSLADLLFLLVYLLEGGGGVLRQHLPFQMKNEDKLAAILAAGYCILTPNET